MNPIPWAGRRRNAKAKWHVVRYRFSLAALAATAVFGLVACGKPTPALVYKRREHLISLVAIPRPGGADNNTPVARFSRDGYTVLSWSGQDFAYLAVSDIAHDDLAAFVSQWRAETRQK